MTIMSWNVAMKIMCYILIIHFKYINWIIAILKCNILCVFLLISGCGGEH